MLWTIFVILLILWLLGMVSSYTLGGFIHLLLLIALVLLVFQLISGRRVVSQSEVQPIQNKSAEYPLSGEAPPARDLPTQFL